MCAMPAADDFDAIRARIAQLRIDATRHLACAIWHGGTVTTCWCYRAAIPGQELSIPCPVRPAATPAACDEAKPPFRMPGLTPVPWFGGAR